VTGILGTEGTCMVSLQNECADDELNIYLQKELKNDRR
jgi:hypothetical protein